MKRVKRVLDGILVNGYNVNGKFFKKKKEAEAYLGLQSAVMSKHCTNVNPLYGIAQLGVADENWWEPIKDAFCNFNCPWTRNGLPSISVTKLIKLADKQELLYSPSHPESTNHPAYDAALTVLLNLCKDKIVHWGELFSPEVYTMVAESPGIEGLMQDLGYNTNNFSGSIAQTLNTFIEGKKLVSGLEANKAWLKSHGLSQYKVKHMNSNYPRHIKITDSGVMQDVPEFAIGKKFVLHRSKNRLTYFIKTLGIDGEGNEVEIHWSFKSLIKLGVHYQFGFEPKRRAQTRVYGDSSSEENAVVTFARWA